MKSAVGEIGFGVVVGSAHRETSRAVDRNRSGGIPAPHADAAVYAKKFTGWYRHRVAPGGIGHNLPQEAPQVFAKAVLDVSGKAD
jgi:hypothetical protein